MAGDLQPAVALEMRMTRPSANGLFIKSAHGLGGRVFLANKKEVQYLNNVIINDKHVLLFSALLISAFMILLPIFFHPIGIIVFSVCIVAIIRGLDSQIERSLERKFGKTRPLPERTSALTAIKVLLLARGVDLSEAFDGRLKEVEGLAEEVGIDISREGANEFWLFNVSLYSVCAVAIYFSFPYAVDCIGPFWSHPFDIPYIVKCIHYFIPAMFLSWGVFLWLVLIASTGAVWFFRLVHGRRPNIYDLVPHYDELIEAFPKYDVNPNRPKPRDKRAQMLQMSSEIEPAIFEHPDGFFIVKGPRGGLKEYKTLRGARNARNKHR